MPYPRRFLLSAFTNWLAFAATLLVSFFLSPYLIRTLGDSRYGVWVFVESILAYFTLFDLGIAACVVRYVAKFQASDDQAELNRLVSSCLVLFVGLGVLAFLLSLALTPFIAPMMSKSGMNDGEIAGFMLLMLGNLALSLPLGIFPAVLDGLGHFTAKSAVRTFFLALRTIAIVVLVERQSSLLGLGIIFTIVNLAEHLVLGILCFKFLPCLKLSLRFVDRATLQLVKGYSFDAFLAMIASRVAVQSGAIVIGIFLSAPEITWFAISLRLVEFAKAMLRSATATLTPAISSFEASGNMDAIRRVLFKGTRWVLYLIIPVHLGLIVFGRPFLRIWLGSPDYAGHCYPSLIILSATMSMVVAMSVASRILYGMGRLRRFAHAMLLEALANLVLSLILVQHLGITGVAWASAIPNFLCCLYVFGYTCRVLEVSWIDYASVTCVRPLVAGLVALAVWMSGWTIKSWPDFGIVLMAGLAPYALAVCVLEGFTVKARRWLVAKRRFFVRSTSSTA